MPLFLRLTVIKEVTEEQGFFHVRVQDLRNTYQAQRRGEEQRCTILYCFQWLLVFEIFIVYLQSISCDASPARPPKSQVSQYEEPEEEPRDCATLKQSTDMFYIIVQPHSGKYTMTMSIPHGSQIIWPRLRLVHSCGGTTVWPTRDQDPVQEQPSPQDWCCP